MKNIFLVLFCTLFFSCANDEKKDKVPFETIPAKEVIFSKELIEPEKKLLFTVQIAASKKAIKRFEIIENIVISREGAFVKYRTGSFETYKEAKEYRKQLIKKYKGAFVQALLNNAPISITAALAH
ncbi:MAG: SPOR domain-containing protein [Polaribacter sp.]|jgi:hypothetical protein|uniref:SPOR domain-containing protein n=1 Tax=Polaribacter sp. TaxID=1920175 RepID=UPI00384B587B